LPLLRHLFTIITPPIRCCSSSGEPASGIASSLTSSPALAGELRSPVALDALCAYEAPPCLVAAPPVVHYGLERATGPPRRGAGPQFFPSKNNSEFDKSHNFCVEPPELVVNYAAVPVRLGILQHGPSILKSNCEYDLNPSKIPQISLKNPQTAQEPLSFAPRPSNQSKNYRFATKPPAKTVLPLKASKAHIFWSRAPFHMILAPKFSEFIALSIPAFIHNNCLLHCIYLSIVFFALGNSVPEVQFKDF
jgi:hypothetical protein